MDQAWVKEEHGGDIDRSEDHIWESGKAGARHAQRSTGRDGAPDAMHSPHYNLGRLAGVVEPSLLISVQLKLPQPKAGPRN